MSVSSQHTTMHSTSTKKAFQVPRLAYWLAALLVLPLWGLVFAGLTPWATQPIKLLFSVNIYAAILIGFFAAMGWTFGILQLRGGQRALMMILGVVYTWLAAFAAMPVLSLDTGLLLLLVVTGIQWLTDVRLCLTQAEIVGLLRLRTGMALGVLVGLAGAWWLVV